MLPLAALLHACATDNGDAVHGPQFGPTPERPDAAVDGAAAGDDAALRPDASAVVDSSADSAPLGCTSGTVAVLAGSDSALSGAIQAAGGAWVGGAIAGGAARSAPALVSFGTGFVGLTQGPSDAVQSVTAGASFGSAASVGALTTLGSPAVTVVGTNAQAVLLSGPPDTNKFYRIQISGSAWGSSGDPVAPSGNPTFGPSAGAVVAAGTELVFAQAGNDQGLYTQRWDGAAWSVGVAINGAGTLNTVAPALVAVDGTNDLVLLYADNTADHVIGFATRSAASKAWSPAQITHALALTQSPMGVARLSATTVLVTYRGTNGRPYVMLGTAGSSVTWTAPVALLADASVLVDAAPAVAKGVCGDDAIAVFGVAGQVKATRYRAGAWSTPEAVTGASGGRVSVATR